MARMDTALRAAAPALALALGHEPFYRLISCDGEDEAARRRLLEEYFHYSLLEARRIGRCIVPQDPAQGAAAWTLPQPEQVSAAAAADKSRFLHRLLGPKGRENHRRLLEFMAVKTCELHLQDAWYLSILGVHPRLQGLGIGAALIAPTLIEAARAGATAYLETFDPRNHRFYARAGFAEMASFIEPVSGSRYWIFRKEPQDPAIDAA